MYTIPTTLQTALTNKTPQRVLIEFANKTFSNEKVAVTSGVELDEIFQSADDFTVGGTPSAEIRFTLINENNELNNFAFGRFTAWLGARIDSGTPGSNTKTETFTENGVTKTYQFTPLGTFIAERPNVVNVKAISITANDQMQLFDVDMPKDNASGFNITWPATLATLYTKMCSYVGVSYRTSSFTNSNLVVSSRPKAFNNATMRDVLSWIAEAAGSVCRFNRDGKLDMVWFNTVNKTYDENDYSGFEPYWYETTAVNGLAVRSGSNEHVTGSGSNKYLIKDNPFLTGNNQSTYETAVYNRLNAAPTFHPASASLFENWNVEAGDVVTVQNEGTNYSVPMYNVHIRWTGDTKVDTESTGKKKRDSLPEVEKRYYSGGVGARAFADEQQGWYVSITDDVNSVRADLAVTASEIYGRVEDAEGNIATLTEEASTIRAEVENALNDYAEFVIEANSIRSRINTAEGNITTLEQTSNSIRAWAEGAENRIGELELSQSGLIVKVGQKNTTYRQWNDPRTAAGGNHDVIPGDRWIKTKGVNRWNDVQTKAWSDVTDLPWKDAAGPQEYVWTGTHWELVNDYGSDVLLGAQFSVLDDRIQGVVRDMDGRTSMIEQTANYIKSTVTDTKNGLSSMILQEASQIRSEVTDTVDGMQSSITQNANRIALVIEPSNNSIKANKIIQAINNDQSSTLISADKVLIDGDTTVAGVLSVTGGVLYVEKQAVFRHSVQIMSTGSLSTPSVSIVGSGMGELYNLSAANVGNLITALQIVQDGNVYTLQKQTVYDSSQWTDVASFNRGTTPVLSGAWDGAIYTVTATGATPATTSIQLMPNGNGQATSFSAEVYNDDPSIAANKRLSEYVYLTESVSTKYVYARWGSSTGTPYARVSTAETYNDGYRKGADATVSISGSWNTGTATYTATALPGTNKTVSTTVFLVPEGNGQANNFSVHTTHTAGNTSAVKLRTEKVYVTEDVANQYAYARWASTTGTTFARVSTSNTYNAGKSSVTLAESWDLPNGTYTVTASNSSTNKKSTTIYLVPDGNNQANNFSVYATHTAGTTTAAKVRTGYVYATEDVSGKKVDVRWGSASNTPLAHVDTTATYNAGKADVTLSRSISGNHIEVRASNNAVSNTYINLTPSEAGGDTPADYMNVSAYYGSDTVNNRLITRTVNLAEVASSARSACRVNAKWNNNSIYAKIDTGATWDAGAKAVALSAAWSGNTYTVTASSPNSSSRSVTVHTIATGSGQSNFTVATYRGVLSSNVVDSDYVYLEENASQGRVEARFHAKKGEAGASLVGQISTTEITKAAKESVTLSESWSNNTYTVSGSSPNTQKKNMTVLLGQEGNGSANTNFTVCAYSNSVSSSNRRNSQYVYLTKSSDLKTIYARWGGSADTNTICAGIESGYEVTTSQFSTQQAPYIGNSQDSGYTGSTNLGTLSKSNIQANAYIFFTVRVHGTNKKYRITVNP